MTSTIPIQQISVPALLLTALFVLLLAAPQAHPASAAE
jgi:hypothetical protein